MIQKTGGLIRNLLVYGMIYIRWGEKGEIIEGDRDEVLITE